MDKNIKNQEIGRKSTKCEKIDKDRKKLTAFYKIEKNQENLRKRPKIDKTFTHPKINSLDENRQ